MVKTASGIMDHNTGLYWHGTFIIYHHGQASC